METSSVTRGDETTPLRVKGHIEDISSELDNEVKGGPSWIKCPEFYCFQENLFQKFPEGFVVIHNAGSRGRASDGKGGEGSKLRNETSVSHLREVVEAESCSAQIYLLHPR
ncbi:hypothetical protein TNCV_2205851 [Trichonephila clavipes]|nr:hypothetical protein TNCV_2205851 [Trichonephila clavipes]